MPRPFRFGAAIDADESDPSGRAWRDRAKRIEDLGYATLLIPDHFVTTFSPVPALAAACAATSTLRVGTMVFDNDFRYPALLAKDSATLDVVSDGRFEVGIGAGWHEPEYVAAGIPFEPAAVRVAKLAESVAILKGLWSGESFSFKGSHYTITNMTGLPRPLQQPHPPVMVGGGGKQLLRFAAREANIISFAAHLRPGGVEVRSLTADGVAERIEWIREAAGSRFGEIELMNYYSMPAVLTRDRDAGADQILAGIQGRFGAEGMTREDVFASPHYLVGDTQQMIDTLLERRERFGSSYICFTDNVEQYKDVVSALDGR
ncbi:MAG: TIGR03621 family F420-dependent LLM class oxidoreductase [Actinomycetota bacterium]|nr:TIGR03621 family F420-dependent LLM class oxidoreductase [Actinomycetota bacterium]